MGSELCIRDRGSSGKGGTVSLIADLNNPDSTTQVDGTISARGGDLGGDGGFVETSGGRVKIGDATRLDTRAPQGKTGKWLLDPVDFTIASSGGDITGTVLGAALGLADVTIDATGSSISCAGATCGMGSGTNGDIFVNDAVTWSAINTLTLNAYNNININSSLTASGASVSYTHLTLPTN